MSSIMPDLLMVMTVVHICLVLDETFYVMNSHLYGIPMCQLLF